MSELISSSQNSKIKFLRSLYRKKYRREENKFLLEGRRIVEDALKEKANLSQAYYSPQFIDNQINRELVKKLKSNTEVFQIEDSLLEEVADTETPQGIIAVVDQPEFDLNEFVAGENDFFLIVDKVQDPGNLGTIVRTADGAGVDGIFLLKGTVDIYNLKTIRATMGSLFRVPIFHLDKPDDLNKILQIKDIQIVVGDVAAKNYYYELDYKRPTAIVVGNEGRGVQQETLKLAKHKVKIPLAKGVESLNVAIATGVMLYEVARQRN
jgi:TrmH family RNA methyltransferase